MIRVLMPLFALVLQTPSPTPAPTVPTEPPPAAAPVVVEAWPGTFAEGFAALQKHAHEQQFESARLIADRLLAPNGFLRWKNELRERGGWRARFIGSVQPTIDWLNLDGLDADARAEVWFARGVVDALAKMRPEAEADFEAARAGAHDRTLRHDAIYDLGVLALEAGEEIRATIPEISGKPPAPPLPLPLSGAAGAPSEPPDPIQLARAAYLKARDHFVERLKSDWRDADTQANVELCLKRLRELDLIEKKREEEKQKQEEQQKQEQKNDQDQKDKDQKDQQDPNQKNDEQDPKNEPKPEDQKPKDEEQKKHSEPKPEDKADEKQPDEKKDAEQVTPPGDPKDAQQMSREEMTQLLDRLKQLEDDYKKIQAQLKAARRGKVKKDW